jgi:hypothetical protein
VKANDRFRPFSNGTEWHMFLERNCDRGNGGCRHYKPNASSSRHGCPIEVALAMASCNDGTIKASIGLRGGMLEPGEGGDLIPVDVFPPECPEYRGYDEPDDRPRRGPKAPEGQQDLLDPRNEPAKSPSRAAA